MSDSNEKTRGQPDSWTFEEWLGSNRRELLPNIVDLMRQAWDAGSRLKREPSDLAKALVAELLSEDDLIHPGVGADTRLKEVVERVLSVACGATAPKTMTLDLGPVKSALYFVQSVFNQFIPGLDEDGAIRIRNEVNTKVTDALLALSKIEDGGSNGK